jgi:hypothetical protein
MFFIVFNLLGNKRRFSVELYGLVTIAQRTVGGSFLLAGLA